MTGWVPKAEPFEASAASIEIASLVAEPKVSTKSWVSTETPPPVLLNVKRFEPTRPVLPNPAKVAIPFTARTWVEPVRLPESIVTSIEIDELATVFPAES